MILSDQSMCQKGRFSKIQSHIIKIEGGSFCLKYFTLVQTLEPTSYNSYYD